MAANKPNGANGKLRPKQERFISEYLIDLNATQAAIRAGYSAHTAKSIGQENLTKPAIASAIAAAQNKAAEKAGVTLDWLLEEGKSLMLAAKAAKDFSAASSTYERVAKIAGHWVDRAQSDVNAVQRVYSSEPLTEEEWASRLPH